MVKFSLIGAGRIAHRHAEHIMKQGKLIAVCDINPIALKKFKEAFPDVMTYNSIEELLENDKDSDVINICTPNGLHHEHAIKVIKAGKHVVVEKPMALSTNDCLKMIEESYNRQKYLFVVKQNRYNPPIVKLKELVESKKLGKIYSAQLNCFWNRNDDYFVNSEWKGTNKLDGGILYTQFSHFIDLFLWLLGHPTDVEAFANNYNHKEIVEFYDTLSSIVKFETGVIGTMNFTINSFKKNMEGSITIFAENGTVKVGGQYLNELEYQNLKGIKIDNLVEGNTANDYGDYQGSMSNHDKVIENVIDVIQKDARIAVNGFEGMKTVEFIQKIYSSIK